MGHTLQLYIVHRMKALPKIPPLAGLDNFSRCGAGALARESFWVAQRFQRCDSAYVTNHSISPLSFRTGFSREESAFPSWRIPPFLILADALLSLRQTDSLTTPAPIRGGMTIARHVSAGSATDRDHARFARHYPAASGGNLPITHPEQQDNPLREPSCECLCRGGRPVRPSRAQLGSTFPHRRPSRVGNVST